VYSYCLEEIGTARNKTLVKSFIDALTKGGPNGTPRPIEMQSHDPRRFVGDMAAWLHQTLAGEQEMVSSMLRLIKRGMFSRLSPSTIGFSLFFHVFRFSHSNTSTELDSEDAAAQLKEFNAKIMNGAFAGVCRPFKLRITQILSSPTNSPVLAYQLANLLYFYKHRFLGTSQSSALLFHHG
jgi:hypothetical protein